MTGWFVGLLILSCQAFGQFTYTIDQSIPVEVNNKTLSMPWAGGLNSAQVNTIDLNGDNKDDLVIFDRTTNKLLTYLNAGNKYEYAPAYEAFFPSGLHSFVLLRDFDRDGLKDIFTFNLNFGGVSVYKNISSSNIPEWEKLNHYFNNAGFTGYTELLLSKGFNGPTNILPGTQDIPNISDIDGDGDLDIINMLFSNPGTAEYHKNFSIELYGTSDSLVFERQTRRWGDWEECDCGTFAFGQDCAGSPNGRTQHAGGKSLLAIDLDNDGDKDMLFSEESCSELYLLENQGTPTDALMTSSSAFPSTNPINLPLFPAAFYEDVDSDGKSDLIVAPNLYARTFTTSTNFSNSLWYYKNTGTEQLPQFTFQKNNFLQDDMIDVGDYAVPAFIDSDGDGDQDLFVSNYAGPGFASSVRFYENIGSASQASFKLTNEDFIGFSNSAFFNVKIQFADLNADAKLDFVFTATSFQTGITSLSFIPNQSASALDFSGQSVQSVNFSLGQQENILIVDVDQDGLTDILIGKATGAVHYWRNIGSAQPAYTLVDDSFLELASSTDRQNPTLAVSDLDADGRADLVLGNQRGELTIYGDFRAQNPNIAGISEIIYNPLMETHESKNLGSRIWPTAVNLFNSNKPALVCGTLAGGLVILKNEDGATLPDEPVITIFPNPVRSNETFKIQADRNVIVQFYNLLGQRISNSYFIPANQEYPIVVSGLLPGIYIARFSYQGKSTGRRFVIIN
jgi:FG-GAP-like repeat/Secretion system C-terminal sorting domain